MDGFLLPNGIKIGHADDDHTGVTCILADGAVGDRKSTRLNSSHR